MNLDDMMEVWRSQDTAPLHGVNEPLILLALRQDEAKLQMERRLEKWATYLGCVSFIALMGFFATLRIMFGDNVAIADIAVPATIAVAGLAWGIGKYLDFREQDRLRRGFGDSLRDEVSRRIALLDYQARKANSPRRYLVTGVWLIAFPAAMLFPALRAFEMIFGNVWIFPVAVAAFAVMIVALTVWTGRTWVRSELLPERRRLEALLKELDGQ